jgi:AraC-like DNA-binding protein
MGIYIEQLIFSSALMQGIILIIILLRKRVNLYPNIILSAFIMTILMQVIVRLLNIYSGRHSYFSIAFYIPYLYGPLTYLYLKSSLINYKLKSADILHAVPFLISVIIVIFTEYRLVNIFDYINNDIYNIGDTFIQLLILNIYLYLSQRILSKAGEKNHKKTNIIQAGPWYKKLINIVRLTGISVIILFTLIFYKVNLFGIHYTNLQILLAVLPLMIYFFSYEAYFRPVIFYPVTEINPENNHVKYGNNQLGERELKNIIIRLETYMESEMPFLTPSVSIEKISKSTGISRHHISQAINQELKINFNDYINSKRIEFAKKELINPAKKHLTIAAIAFECGFNSISAFNDAFKKQTLLTPSVYKKQFSAKNI